MDAFGGSLNGQRKTWVLQYVGLVAFGWSAYKRPMMYLRTIRIISPAL
jgi:hypothetical protein